jgi:hypothetical protein
MQWWRRSAPGAIGNKREIKKRPAGGRANRKQGDFKNAHPKKKGNAQWLT